MGAVRYRARADLRRTIGGTVLLVLMVGLVGSVVLAVGTLVAANLIAAFPARTHPAEALRAE